MLQHINNYHCKTLNILLIKPHRYNFQKLMPNLDTVQCHYHYLLLSHTWF